MLYYNGEIFVDGHFQKATLRTSNGKIAEIGAAQQECTDADSYDLKGNYLIPGFVDIHSHGCVGYDFSNAGADGIEAMCDYYYKNGITTILATTMTNEYSLICKAMETINKAAKTPHSGSRIAGINMEGPFLGKEKKGAHDERYLLQPSDEKMDEMLELSGNSIKIMSVDPMLDNAIPFIRKYSKKLVISMAHTACDYSCAAKAIDAGAKHITHLFNAMNGLHHREPGLPGALMDFDIMGEIICDGIHVCPSVVRLMFAAVPEKLILISDSMSAAGLPDGEYELGGQKVYVRDKKATLADGTIAGSTTNVYQAVRNVIDFGIEKEKAILAATANPAKAVGIFEECGSIAVGKRADLLIMKKSMELIGHAE